MTTVDASAASEQQPTPTIHDVIADAIGAARWPDGTPVIRLAGVYRKRVAGEILQAIGDAGYVVLTGREFASMAGGETDG